MSAETSQTLDRGLRLLALLATESGASVTGLAARLGVSRPALYRLLATLEAHGLVERRAGGQVRLGLGLVALARAVIPGLADTALPVLRRLADEAGATAHLSIAELDEAVAVAVVEPSHTTMHVAYRVGARHPLERGAAGRAILLARGGGGGAAFAGFGGESRAGFGARGGDGGDLGGAGFVVTEGELQPGAVGVAAPVIGVAGLEASVGVVAIGSWGGGAGQVGPLVVRAAEALAAALT